jgi:chorismate mutase
MVQEEVVMGNHGDGLRKTRERIDAIDREIARLVQERALLALDAARHKKSMGLSLLDVPREEEVLRNFSATPGPLDPDTMRRVWRLVMYETRKREEEG